MLDETKIDMFMLTNAKYFPDDKLIYIRERLEEMDDKKYSLLLSMEKKDPTLTLVMSLMFGFLGIDRFLVGDTGLGVLKLLTFGCCGIFTIVDWFLIHKRTKEINFLKLMTFV